MIYSIEFLYMIKNLKKFLKKLGEALYKIFHWFGSGAKRSGAKRSGAKLQSQTSGKSYLVLSLNFFNYFCISSRATICPNTVTCHHKHYVHVQTNQESKHPWENGSQVRLQRICWLWIDLTHWSWFHKD